MDWPQIIRDIMKEQKVSQRNLALSSGLCRSKLKRFFRGETHLRTDALECVLAALGYEIDLFKLDERVR